MSILRHKIATIAVTVSALVAVTLLVVVQIGASAQQRQAAKLEGAWIAKVQGGPGQWIYNFAPDASGRSASLHAGILIHPEGTPGYALEHHTPIIGEMVMTGSNSASLKGIFYSTQEAAGEQHEIVGIGLVRGTTTFLGPGMAEGTYTFEFYPGDADVDGDGLPEGLPDPTVTVTTVETRLR